VERLRFEFPGDEVAALDQMKSHALDLISRAALELISRAEMVFLVVRTRRGVEMAVGCPVEFLAECRLALDDAEEELRG
jgi:hypothetical protein